MASTNTNRSSSRAHTIITIHVDQLIQANSGDKKRASTINFIDLAGKRKI